jgi:YVTN family beta-propeller protein
MRLLQLRAAAAGAVTLLMLAAMLAGGPVAGAAPASGSASSKVVAVTGAPLSSIVVSAAGVAYVTNPSGDQVEVLDLTNRVLRAPIAVGPQPRGLDLSPDGTTLYVADNGADEVSVVDIASGKETHRIATPPGAFYHDTPYSIAVAANGKALVTTDDGRDGPARLLEIDLTTEAVRLRSDFGNFAGETTYDTRLAPSGDHRHIGVIQDGSSLGPIWIYDAARDAFGPERDVGNQTRHLALDGTGSRMLVDPGAYVFDGSAILGRVPGGGMGLVVAPSGMTAYRVQDSVVEVLDLGRQQVAATIALPEHVAAGPGAIAVSPDGASLAVLTATGISVVSVADAQPVSGCANTVTKTSPSSAVLALCGAPLANLVADGTGHVFASNPTRNEIDVIDVHTATLETTIPVGSEPRGLDLTPDGTTLYVADSGGSQVSVIDVASRRETRRINIPPPTSANSDSPFSIAVADNGQALLGMTEYGFGSGGRMLELNLTTGTVRLRSDFENGVAADTALTASGDHSHIGVVEDTSDGSVWVYDAATDSFGTSRQLANNYVNVAVDRTGSRVVVDPDAHVIDHGVVTGAVPGGGRGIVLASSGDTAYRVQDTMVEVLDLNRLQVTATIALPENWGYAPGSVALSSDGATLAVLTATGVSVVAVAAARPTPQCTNAATQTSTVFGLLALCGSPLHAVVMDGAGHAFASNETRNEIVVVNVRSGALESTIPVGSEPAGVALTPDGATLYVADRGGDQVSVVDVATRRETRRINIPPHPDSGFDTPESIVVANNGKALLATSLPGSGWGARLLEIDLKTGAVQPRLDFNGGFTTEATILAASGDHSHIGIGIGDVSNGPTFMYTAATDSFSAVHYFGFIDDMALDQTGSRVVVDSKILGTILLDGNLAQIGTFPTYGVPVIVGADGTGYRQYGDLIEVLDVGRRSVGRSIPLPDTPYGYPGTMAVSPDGATLAVLTNSGLALVNPAAPVPATLTNPVNGQNGVDTSRPFTWNGVATAQGYILVVGTTPNGTDLVNSGVLAPGQTAFNVPELPTGKPLYASLLTESYGTWTLYQSVTFTAAAGHATFTNPLNGQNSIDTTKAFSWNPVAGAQGYILVVGTTRNGTDLVNSGVLPASQTTLAMPDLPAGRTLYAALLTKVNGAWTRYQAISFTAAVGHGTFTSPVNGKTVASVARQITWATVPGAQGYILVVGTTVNGTDLVNSGVLPAAQSTYPVPALPKGKTLHAALLTKINGAFTRYQAISFTEN